MRFSSASVFLDRTSDVLRRNPSFSKFLFLASLGCGVVVAYADAGSDSVLSKEPSKPPVKKKVVVLGTGWAGTSFLRDLNSSLFDVQIVSPRNYFAFTPLLPSVTCGTVDARSITEPIRKIIKRKDGDITFCEAECTKIDPANKKVHCHSDIGTNLDGYGEFVVDYDYLVIAIGAQVNTFNTPGVQEHCHFLKEVEDAQKIRRSVVDCFERASLPDLSEQERRRNLHFIVIGAGPTGIEFAAELHDFVFEDLAKLYPKVKDLVKISIISSGEHILTSFDQRISAFAEKKFQRDGIEVFSGFRAVEVSDKSITMKSKSKELTSVPYGMSVWSTGICMRPVILEFMKQIAQGDRRVLATDAWLRVRGCDDIYALGDCSTISQSKVMDDISAIFKMADKDNSNTLTIKEIQDVLEDICELYPQVDLYLKSHHMKDFTDLLDVKDDSVELKIEEFKKALANVDSEVKTLPATAQVAAQQGAYLATCFNRMNNHREQLPEGPIRIQEGGHYQFHPFRYKHLGQFAPLGGEQTAAQLPGDWISIGHGSQWLWYSVYASKQVSWRTRVAVVSDWAKRYVFGRDSSRI